MSASNAFEQALMALIFNGTAIANLADNAAASPLTSLYISLHTADPGESGNQTTSEVNYTGYARVALTRSPAGWTVTNGTATPVNPIEFGEMTAGTPGTATHFAVGTASSGTGMVIVKGTITPNINFNVGSVPRLRNTTSISLD